MCMHDEIFVTWFLLLFIFPQLWMSAFCVEKKIRVLFVAISTVPIIFHCRPLYVHDIRFSASCYYDLFEKNWHLVSCFIRTSKTKNEIEITMNGFIAKKVTKASDQNNVLFLDGCVRDAHTSHTQTHTQMWFQQMTYKWLQWYGLKESIPLITNGMNADMDVCACSCVWLRTGKTLQMKE